MKVLVAIAANLEFDPKNKAISAAGNQVQLEILRQAEIFFNGENVSCLLHIPTSSWPSDRLWISGGVLKNILSLSYLNLPFIKSIYYALQIFLISLKTDINMVIKYNITFSEAIFLNLLKIFKKDIKIALVIQDVHSVTFGIKGLRGCLDFMAIHLSRRFDALIPVSENIKADFNLPSHKTYIFRGGITRQTRSFYDMPPKIKIQSNSVPYAVFAGALEPYNGVDILINYWLVNKPSIQLKIYGNGSLANLIRRAEAISSGSISFMGHVEESIVSKVISGATINFCLRYSRGINQNYFFPSKFFNLLAAPGILICNNFGNLPEMPENFVGIVNDDLSNLKEVMGSAMKLSLNEICLSRRLWLTENCGWERVIKFICMSK